MLERGVSGIEGGTLLPSGFGVGVVAGVVEVVEVVLVVAVKGEG